MIGTVTARTPGGVAMASTLGMGIGGIVQAVQDNVSRVRRERAYRSTFGPSEADDSSSREGTMPDWVPLRHNSAPRHRRAQLQVQLSLLKAEAARLDQMQLRLQEPLEAEGTPPTVS